jgi:hypothetical protein
MKNELLMAVYNHHKSGKNIAIRCHKSQVNKMENRKFSNGMHSQMVPTQDACKTTIFPTL